MDIETTVNETIPEVPSSPEKTEPEDNKSEQESSPVKDDSSAETVKKGEKRPIEAPKNNGTVTPVKKSLPSIIVQYPEIFSMKRDSHFLDRLSDASDIKFTKVAYVECDSPEAAEALHEKLNGSEINGKKVVSSRMSLVEKKVLYCNGLKKEDNDQFIRDNYQGVQEIKHESYNTFILFDNENNARAARNMIYKDGLNGHRIICEFDNGIKDRFAKPEPPAEKKAKVEETKPAETTEEQTDAEMKDAEETKEEDKSEEIKEESVEEEKEEEEVKTE